MKRHRTLQSTDTLRFCTISRPARYRGWLLILCYWCLAFAGRAQTITVPLGQAAQFGMLSGGSITLANSQAPHIRGAIGADTIVGAYVADSGAYNMTFSGNASAVTALANLATARSYCSGLTSQSLAAQLGDDTLTAGAYTAMGNVQLGTRQRLTLIGDSTSVFVLNIGGSLIMDTAASINLSGIRSDQVYWNVSGNASFSKDVSFAGILLCGSSISQDQANYSKVSLLALGNISLSFAYALGSNDVWAFNTLRALGTPAPCPPASSSAQNPVFNGDLELFNSCPNGHSQIANLCSWGASPTRGTPDYINHCGGSAIWDTRATIHPYSVYPWTPEPFFSELPRQSNKDGYCGIYTYVNWAPDTYNQGLHPDYREYVQQVLPTPVTIGALYYSEFWWSLADYCPYAISTLGLLLSSQTRAGGLNNDGNIVLNSGSSPQQLAAGSINATTPLATKNGWESIWGFVQPTAAWDRVTVGNFTPNGATNRQADQNLSTVGTLAPALVANAGSYNNAYYLLDDIAVVRLPDQGTNKTFCPPTPTYIGSSGTFSYPAGYSVTYHWKEYPSGATGSITNATAYYTQVNPLLYQGGAVGQTSFQYQFTVTVNGHAFTCPPITVSTVVPIPDLTASKTTICLGDPVTLSVIGAPAGTTYSWTKNGSSFPAGNNIASITDVPSSVGTVNYTVTMVYLNTNCGMQLTQTVNVVTPPPATITASTTRVCAADLVQLALNTGGDPYQLQQTTYSTSWPYSTTITISPSPVSPGVVNVYPAVTTTYTLTTLGAGCNNTDQVLIIVDPLPQLQIQGAQTPVFVNEPPLPLTVVDPTSATPPTGGTWTCFVNNASVPGLLSGTPGSNQTAFVPNGSTLAPPFWATVRYIYADPVTGCTGTTSVQIQVLPQEDCFDSVCPYVIELDAVYDLSIQPSPFGYGPECYHAAHNVLLLNGNYYLPPGCRIYFDKDVNLTVGPGAYLEASYGATFTAACYDMWGGILVDDGPGIRLTDCEVSHSGRGVVLRYPNVPAVFDHCNFLNNKVSIQVIAADQKVGGTNEVTNCSFNVTGFKRPYRGVTGWADAHISLGDGEYRDWVIEGNSFQKAYIGVFGGVRTDETGDGKTIHFSLAQNTFALCGLGVCVSNSVQGWSGRIEGQNVFTLPSYLYSLSAHGMAVVTQYQVPAALRGITMGVYVDVVTSEDSKGSRIENNQFVYATAPGSFYGLSPYPTLPRGVRVEQTLYQSNLTVKGNTFQNLDDGLAVATEEGSGLQVVDNTFANCRVGLRFMPFDGRFSYGVPNSVRVSCNTFARHTPYGQSVGIKFDKGAVVELAYRDVNGNLIDGTAQPATPGDGVKNLFADQRTRSNLPNEEFWYVHNYADGSNDNPQLVYRTFAPNMSMPGPQTNTGNIFTFGDVDVTSSLMPSFNSSHSCQTEDGFVQGIQQRAAGTTVNSSGHLAIPVPNPADASVTFAYSLPTGTAGGELVLRESLQGVVVYRSSAPAERTETTLAVGQLRSGLYLASLVVEGRVVASVRLQLAH